MSKLQAVKNFFHHKAVKIIGVVLILSLVGLGIYEAQDQFMKLRDRVSAIESEVHNSYTPSSSEQGSTTVSDKVEYKILSSGIETVRVEKPTEYYGQGEAPPKEYESKKFYVYHIQVTNNTTSAASFSSSDVKGKTADGVLIDATYSDSIHPKDRKGRDSVNLAPKGVADIYVYIPADKVITELYYQDPNNI